jgi:RNA 2',3'-cyclic 3'-phosphodiesterase
MRLFAAIDLPDQIHDNLDRLVEKLKPTARLTWSRPSNFHITTKFIGEWPAGRLDELKRALDSLRSRAPIPIAVRALGFFPDRRRPRVFWAGVEAPPDLAALAAGTDAAAAGLGVKPETRPYSPHLTLARNREGRPVQRLVQAVDELGVPEFGAFTAYEFCLYQSERRSTGSVYTKLSEHKFSQ